MKRHPNMVRIDQLIAEIKQLSEATAAELLDAYFEVLVKTHKAPSGAEFARQHGVKQAWFNAKLNADHRTKRRNAEWKAQLDADASKF